MTLPDPPPLDSYPAGDAPEDNLRRMYFDQMRVDGAIRRIDALLEAGEALTILAIDLDRSAVVRARGVVAKRQVVVQMQERIRARLAPPAEFLDSGSRDEGWIVLRDASPSRARELGEELRALVAVEAFDIPDGERVRLTASVGVVEASRPRSTGRELLWSAGEALWQAKRSRDCLFFQAGPLELRELVVQLPRPVVQALTELADRERRSRESLVHEAVQQLVEKHAALWHWVVDRGARTMNSTPVDA